MFYIITPYINDFRNICIAHDFPFSNGRSLPSVKWINSVEQLYGIKIFKSDVVIKGYDYIHFPTKIIDLIEIELAIRTEK